MHTKHSPLKRIATALLFLAAIPTVTLAATDDYDTLVERISNDFQSAPDITADLKTFDIKKGSFSDIDYASTAQDGWQPRTHLNRLSNLVYAYTNKKSKLYGNENVYNNIVKALSYWMERRPKSTNWWYAQVAEPQSLGVMLVKMRQGKHHLPKQLEQNILNHMREDGGDPAKWTGANRTDLCLHWIYRAAVERNDADLKRAMELAFEPIKYSTGEGFQCDGSFFQHGQQLYIGGYGDEILKGITQIAGYAAGTKFALSADKKEMVRQFMLHSFYPTIRGKYKIYNSLGRGVSRNNSLNASNTALYARRMMTIDPEYAAQYQDIVSRIEGKAKADKGVASANTHFYRADYTLHTRPAYSVGVRFCSTRTSRMEYGNGENLKAYYVSDGSCSITKTGDEYLNIFPAWDWTRIPGVTAPVTERVPLAKKDWELRGTSQFAGGVSDSIYGASTYAYYDSYDGINTGARKSWFFFDDEVVCLGAGVTSSSQSDVQTTVNQCLDNAKWTLDYTDGNSKKQLKLSDNIAKTDIKWVRHNGVAYVFPKGGKVTIERKKQTGNWHDINNVEPNRTSTLDVATVAIDHGTHPQNASYAYVIVPENTSDNALDKYAQSNEVSILSNSKKLQAVRRGGLGVWQMVFHEKGKYKDRDIEVKTDRPCALMIRRKSDGHVWLHVADPAQRKQTIKVEVKLKGSLKKAKKIKCNFSSTGEKAGATKAYCLK